MYRVSSAVRNHTPQMDRSKKGEIMGTRRPFSLRAPVPALLIALRLLAASPVGTAPTPAPFSGSTYPARIYGLSPTTRYYFLVCARNSVGSGCADTYVTAATAS